MDVEVIRLLRPFITKVDWMDFGELLMIAIGLSMDAFAVSVGAGLAVHKLQWKHYLIAGSWFGAFQALMPLIGYFLAVGFASLFLSINHWISFVLLCLIGINMIWESLHKDKEEEACVKKGFDFGTKTMLLLSVATSIDALAAGFSFAFLETNICEAVLVIGTVTFLLSALGIKLGHVFGTRYRVNAELLGGVVLILMGIKILVEHLIA